jgi:Macrocin-O-methyltransferase (TylF)
MDHTASGREIMKSLRVHDDARERPRKGSVLAAIHEVSTEGDYAQFGVFRGATARFIESHMTGARKLHLFDSFEGLPEDWIEGKEKGAFRLDPDRIPTFDSERVVVHKGWFKDTVPDWAPHATAPLAFVHLDADLYSSTIEALFNINHLILQNAIVLFDEYVKGGLEDEHRALLDWAKKYSRTYEYLWRSSASQVCVRILN